MKNVKILILSGVLAAIILASIISSEKTTVMFFCLVVAFVGLLVGIIRFIVATRARWQALLLTLVPVVLFVVIVWFHIPLRIAFRVYRADFDRAVRQIEEATPPATPFWIGPFRILMAGRRGDSGTPYLATNRADWEINGFVKSPDGFGFNLWSCIKLDDTWSYIEED